MKYRVSLVVCENDMTWHYEEQVVDLEPDDPEIRGDAEFIEQLKNKAINQRPSKIYAYVGVDFYDDID